MKKIIVLLLLSVGLAGCLADQNKPMVAEVVAEPDETRPQVVEVEIPDDWVSYESSRYGYTFAYPPNWTFLAYDEDNPQVQGGVHTLHNYEVDGIEKYMNHGMVDWEAFMGETPVIKMDVLVQNLDERSFEDFVKEMSDGQTEVTTEELMIDKLATKSFVQDSLMGSFQRAVTYIAQINEETAVAIVRFTLEDDDALRKSDQWELLEKVFGSFEFD